MKGMIKEHSSTTTFSTPTYKISTNPKAEWSIVYSNEPIPVEQKNSGRRVPNYNELLSEDKKKPDHLRAQLRAEEIIAIILYSGPMVRMIFVSVPVLLVICIPKCKT